MRDDLAQPLEPEPKSALLARNVLHLGAGQIVTGVLGFVLTAALGRFLGASDFGVYYIILSIFAFVSVGIDWGQATYIMRETARGRADEAQLIGSALLNRVIGTAFAAVVAVGIAVGFGYDQTIILLAPLAVLVSLPLVLSQPFGYVFRGKDRMDFDAIVIIIGKALTLAATLIVLKLGGGLTDIVLVQAIGGVGALIVGVYLALQLKIEVKAPSSSLLRELLWCGAPLTLYAFALALHPFIDVQLLSLLTAPEVVGWYGAARTIIGLIVSPALILGTASFGEISRAASSLPDLHRVLAATARILLGLGAFAFAALYLFADLLVSTIYGHGSFDQAPPILRVAAPFLPVMFLSFLLGSAVIAIGKTKAVALVKVASLFLGAILSWFLIGLFEARFGNGAMAMFISSGVFEILMLISFIIALPSGAVTQNTFVNAAKAYFTALCTMTVMTILPPLPIWLAGPLFIVSFTAFAAITRLILRSDFDQALNMIGGVRSKPGSGHGS